MTDQRMSKIEQLLQEGLALCQSGRLLEGRRVYEALLEVAPHHPRALANLGSIALHEGNLEVSLELFKRSIKIDSQQPMAFFN